MSDRLNAYFASEAAEYLDQLERLLAAPGVPDPDQFLRLSTGVRGSAQMAGATTVASVAERLEDAVRSIISSNIAWSEEIRELSRQTVDDLKLLVRAFNRWGHSEEHRVREALQRWEEVEPDRAAALDEVVPIQSLFHDDEGPHVLSAEEEGSAAGRMEGGSADAVVDIGTLLFRGEAALREALSLRAELEEAIVGDAAEETRPPLEIVAEVFDLIELGLSPERPEV